MKELPKLDYQVEEEKPPYSQGHQCLRSYTKLFVHNIDFQVSREGLLRTFNQFARIKAIKLPMNYKGRSRGLAFMIFATHEDALSAFEAGQLGITLCNRKLVVEVFKPLETLNMERKAKKKLIDK